ncbi:probable cytochrome P450 305a1 [Vanessa tameamea]|uniref:Probable cytochrome P450 305a1 n=1 Tax=Vanessa tameamea TaxID=334116 RepID=A0ABM4AYI7_VANTA
MLLWVLITTALMLSVLVNMIVKPKKYPPGTTFVEGPLWKEHRFFTFKYLRNLDYGKQKIRKIELLSARSKIFTMAGGWLNQWPLLRFIAPEWSGYAVIKSMNDQLYDIIIESINKHKNKSVKGPDFIYAFMDEINKNEETYTGG